MKKYEIHLEDWQRILFGQAPPVFLLEVFIRTLIVYVFLLFVLRWLGKRMSGQLTILEMAIMLTLGAIVSVGVQMPERGITLSMVALICTLIFQRGLSWLGTKSARIEELSQGKMSVLLKDGVMELQEMRRCRISKQQLLAELRSNNIYNLGEVRRVYLEACGLFTTVKMHNPQPGLSTLPFTDKPLINRLPQSNNDMVCTTCGNREHHQPLMQACPHCGDKSWTRAVLPDKKGG